MDLNRLQELGLPSLHFHNMHAMDSAGFTKAHSDSSLFKKKTKNDIVPLLLHGFPRYNKVGISSLERSEIVNYCWSLVDSDGYHSFFLMEYKMLIIAFVFEYD